MGTKTKITATKITINGHTVWHMNSNGKTVFTEPFTRKQFDITAEIYDLIEHTPKSFYDIWLTHKEAQNG